MLTLRKEKTNLQTITLKLLYFERFLDHAIPNVRAKAVSRDLSPLTTPIPHIMPNETEKPNNSKETAPPSGQDAIKSKPLPQLPPPDLDKPLPRVPKEESDDSLYSLGLHRVSCSLHIQWE